MKKNIFLHENNSSEMTFYTVEVLFTAFKVYLCTYERASFAQR